MQWALRARRLAAGSRLTGLKMGLTSPAKMKQMGVETPIYGFLLDEYRVPADSEIEIAGMIHPRIEPEIAVVTRRELHGPGLHAGQALAAIDQVVPASRSSIRGIAISSSTCRASSPTTRHRPATWWVATARPLDELDLRTSASCVEKNGESVAFGAGAAVLGHPALSLAMLANLLARRGEHVPSGTFVMTGGITEAIAAEAR